MAEYPPRGCGPCPHRGAFTKAKDPDYLERNTVPQPKVVFQDQSTISQQHLGVPSANYAPDLTVSPINPSSSKPNVTRRTPDVGSSGCQKCCSAEVKSSSDACPVSPYSVEDCERKQVVGGSETQKPIKGILKNTQITENTQVPPQVSPGASVKACADCGAQQPCKGKLKTEIMANTAGRTAPGQEEPTSKAPVPNELRPVPPSKTPCYLPQPLDDLPEENGDKKMGPIGPWATGRVDWGPLAGLTGTRPVVDKYSITRYSEGEWRKANKDMLDMATSAQHKANLVDWNGRRCLEQTRADIDKNQADNTKRLFQRENDIHRWKCELEMAIAAATEEIALLEEQRRRLKQASAVLMLPESIAGECLERRTGRLNGELVRDEVEEELIKELALTAEIKEQFQRTLKDVNLQMNENRTAKARLEYDWSDKKVAHEIEAVNCALNNNSTTMLFKAGATLFPADQSSAEHWEHFTRETLQEGEATRQRSVTLRGTLDAILTNAARDLRSQADRIELALSRRIACTDQMRIELENNLKNILQRLADVEDLIRDVRDAIRRMDIPMKKVQTRLDNRLLRPRVENCRDDAHFGLVEEVKTIGENVSALMAQLKQAEESQANLIQARSDMEREIMVKRKTLEIDRTRTQLIRSHFPSATALSGH